MLSLSCKKLSYAYLLYVQVIENLHQNIQHILKPWQNKKSQTFVWMLQTLGAFPNSDINKVTMVKKAFLLMKVHLGKGSNIKNYN